MAILFWYNHHRAKAFDQALPGPQPHLEKIIVGLGRNNVSIGTNDILQITTADVYIAIQTSEKKFLHHETLKSMQSRLDPQKFLRIHRSTIINLDAVVSYKSRLNGDYDVLLMNQQETRLSRNYAAAFKMALGNNHRLS